MATTTTVPTQTKLQVTDAEERDGFVEYCKMRTCERMHAERTDELEEADVDQMRVIAIESKIEWRGFTDDMKMFWIERGSVKSTLNAWSTFLTVNNAIVPEVYATGPAPTPSSVQPHAH
ncbi:hypothetical protein BGX29_000799 [Mortierella sp. GBA35]|nr:hypothetical protein BGX29_000799 [Mortierella sp. GBA35]KAF9097530.1 hypothetical protein BGX23_008608 [Mortierella sp. AD031]KAG0217439.1 hypothetical protein BGX33_010624 [Mortierella sp. NVP41]